MLRYPSKTHIITAFFDLSLRLQRANTIQELDTINHDILNHVSHYMTFNHNFHEGANLSKENTPNRYQILFHTCEFYIYKFLNILHARRCRELNGFYDEQAFVLALNELRQLPTNIGKTEEAALQVIYNYITITAEIISLIDFPDNSEANYKNDLIQALKILINLFSASSLAAEIPEQQIPGFTHSFLKESCEGFSIALQGTIIQDRSPKTQAEIYIDHITAELLLNLIRMRAELLENENIEVQKYARNPETKCTQLQDLQFIRCQISRLDAVIGRLNLHRLPTQRQHLQQHISKHRLSDFYAQSKWHLDYRHIHVVSALIDDTNSENLSYHQNLLAEFQTAISMLHAHIALVEEMVAPLCLIDGLPTEVSKNFQIRDLRRTVNGLIYDIYFDTCLLEIQALALVQTHPEYTEVQNELNLLTQLSEAYSYMTIGNIDNRLKIEDKFSRLSTHLINISRMTNARMASALGMIKHLKFDALLKRETTAIGRASVFTYAANDILTLLTELQASTTLARDHRYIASGFIKDYLLYVLLNCTNTDEIKQLYGSTLKEQVTSLIVQPGNQHGYEFLFSYIEEIINNGSNSDKWTKVTLENISKTKILQYLESCEKKMIEGDEKEHPYNVYIGSFFIWNASRIAYCVDKGSDKLLKVRSTVLNNAIATFYFGSHLELVETISNLSPAHIQHRAAALTSSAELKLDYPDVMNLYSHFYDVSLELLQATSVEDINKYQQTINAVGERLATISEKFETGCAITPSLQQHSLYLTERMLYNLLKAISTYCKEQLKIETQDSDKIAAANFFKEFSKQICLTNPSVASMANAMNYTLYFTCDILHLIKTEYNINDTQQRRNFIDTVMNIVSNLYDFMHATKHNLTYEYHEHISYGTFFKIINGLLITLYPDRAPNTAVEKYCCHLINLLVGKLMDMRMQIELLEAELSAKHGNNTKSTFTETVIPIELRNQLAEIDALLIRLNLSNFPELRKKQQNHTQHYRITDIDTERKKILTPRRFFVLSGLVDPHNNKVESLTSRFQLAANALFSSVFDCSFAYGALHIITNSINDDYFEAQEMLIQHLSCICFDAYILWIESASLPKQDSKIKNITGEFLLIYQIAHHLLLSNGKRDTHFRNMRVEDYETPQYTNSYLVDAASCEAFGKLQQANLKQAFALPINEYNRANALRKTASLIKHLCTILKTDKDASKLEVLYQIQFITDLYLFALSLCKNQEQVNVITDPEVRDKVFALNPTSYNLHARNYLDTMLTETIRLQIANNTREVPVSAYDVNVLTNCINHFKLRMQCRKLANALIQKSSGSKDFEIIHMNSTVYIYFCKNTEQLFSYVSQFAPHLLPENLSTAIPFDEKQNYYNLLNLITELYDPLKLSYRPLNMKPSQHIASSFLQGLAPVNKSNNKNLKKAAAKKPEKVVAIAPVVPPKVRQPGSTFKEVAKFYKNDVAEIQKYYLSILNNNSFKIKSDSRIRCNALIGLAECLGLLKDESARQQLLTKIEAHEKHITGSCPQSTLDIIFQGQYSQYQLLILKYKKVPPPALVAAVIQTKPPVAKKAAPASAKATTPKINLFSPQREAAPPVKLLSASTPTKQNPVIVKPAQPAAPQTLDPFREMRKPFSLPAIKLSTDEDNIIKFMAFHKLNPLLQGGAVVDCIRSVPYRDIDCLCFASVTELGDLLQNNMQHLGIAKLELFFNIFYRITFNTTYEGEHDILDVAFINAKDEHMAPALTKLASEFGLGIAMYYCPFSNTIIDPCKQLSRIKSLVLDVSKNMDSSFNINDFFAAFPDRMLICLSKDIKCRKYKVILDSKFIKEAIIENKKLLRIFHFDKKFPQSLFDKLFTHGFANESFHVLHEQCNIMTELFPLFKDNEQDTQIIKLACEVVNKQHSIFEQRLIDAHRFNPKQRVCTLSSTQQNVLRHLFFHELLFPKFIERHDIYSYVTNANHFNQAKFLADFRLHMDATSFKINPAVMKGLEKAWVGEIVSLIQKPAHYNRGFSM